MKYSDEELLEQAAVGGGYSHVFKHLYWNPLENSTDAFSLATKLQLNVSFGLAGGCTVDRDGFHFEWEDRTQPERAIRRTIVMAAAKWGRAIMEATKETDAEVIEKSPEEILGSWKGRMFKCNRTGDVLVIPDTVKFGDFFSFGDECFIDIGDEFYCRQGGDFIEL